MPSNPSVDRQNLFLNKINAVRALAVGTGTLAIGGMSLWLTHATVGCQVPPRERELHCEADIYDDAGVPRDVELYDYEGSVSRSERGVAPIPCWPDNIEPIVRDSATGIRLEVVVQRWEFGRLQIVVQ